RLDGYRVDVRVRVEVDTSRLLVLRQAPGRRREQTFDITCARNRLSGTAAHDVLVLSVVRNFPCERLSSPSTGVRDVSLNGRELRSATTAFAPLRSSSPRPLEMARS